MIILIILLILAVLVVIIGIVSSNMTVKTRVRTHEKQFESLVKLELLKENIFETIPNEEKTILGHEECRIYTRFFRSENSKKTVIIAHGFTANMQRSALYFDMFYKRGYNVMFFDQRYHGKSEGKFITFGFKEKYDLMKVTDYVEELIGKGSEIGLHGESMGSATVIMNGAIDERIDFIVADCGYSDMLEQMEVRFKEDLKLPMFPMFNIMMKSIEIRAGFDITDVKPKVYAKKIKAPTLIIHGGSDNYVPSYMAHEIYNNIQGYKEIEIFKGSDHAESIHDAPQDYDEIIGRFLENIKNERK